MCAKCNINKFYVLPTQHIYALCLDLRTKQRSFPHIALTEWFLNRRRSVFTVRYELNICVMIYLFTAIGFQPGESGRLFSVVQCNHSL